MNEQKSPFDSLLHSTGLAEIFAPAKTASAMRDALERAIPLMELPAPRVHAVHDLHLAGGDGPISARVYVPYEADETGPCLVFYHGGGFTVGSLDTYDAFCRRLAAVSGVRIASIDYRLSPEHRFPAAVEDALAAYDTIRAGRLAACGVDAARIAVGGDSAGANPATVVAQNRRGGPVFQLLIYPLLQLVEIKKKKARWQDGPFLAEPTLSRIKESYLSNANQASDPRVSPLLTPDLKHLAPAYILAAELDPLLAEGAAYADKLAAFGVPVERVVYNGVAHGFVNMTRLVSKAVPAIEAAGRALARAVAA